MLHVNIYAYAHLLASTSKPAFVRPPQQLDKEPIRPRAEVDSSGIRGLTMLRCSTQPHSLDKNPDKGARANVKSSGAPCALPALALITAPPKHAATRLEQLPQQWTQSWTMEVRHVALAPSSDSRALLIALGRMGTPLRTKKRRKQFQ